MASLDAARAAAQAPGAWDAPLEAARLARAGLRALPGPLLLEDCASSGMRQSGHYGSSDIVVGATRVLRPAGLERARRGQACT